MASKITRNYLPELFALGFIRSKPSMVTVNLTEQCNQQCIYCEIGIGRTSSIKNALTINDMIWIIDEMASNGIHKISLCGGEPFLFDGLMDVVDYAGQNKIRCSITSNGMTAHKLTKTDLGILKDWKAEINISIDAFDDEIQSITRGKTGTLSNALKSIQCFKESRIPVTVLTVISKYNYHNLYDLVTKAYEEGIREILFQPVNYSSNYPDRVVVDNKNQLNVGVDNLDALMGQLKKILQFERRHKINTNVYRIMPWIGHYLKSAADPKGNSFFNNVLPKFFCREVYAIIDINYNGGIQPCGLRPATISIKDDKQPGLLSLWMQATKEIRNDLESGMFYKECNTCCHHFSRNMLASMIKYPLENRKTWMNMIPLLLTRTGSRMLKKLYL